MLNERGVRSALSRYEAAYTRLDAEAVRDVWPSVDRRGLARAFDGLASQAVRLGVCQIRVDGASARAECTGTARWMPKVGGEPHIASRRWEFDLKHTGSDWIIVSATVK